MQRSAESKVVTETGGQCPIPPSHDKASDLAHVGSQGILGGG